MTDSIKDTVSRLCRKCKTCDPWELVKSLNIIVVFEPLGTVNGYFGRSYRHKVIHINEDLNEEKARFVLCHELGHAILHPQTNTPFLKENTLFSVNRLEVEANRFAMCLCYPDELFTEEYAGLSVYQTAEVMGLPVPLVKYRLEQVERGFLFLYE